MDINKELESLILKYDIDRPFPSYRKALRDKVNISYPAGGMEFMLSYGMDRLPDYGLGYAIERESENLRRAKNIRHLVDAMQKLIFMFVFSKDFVNSFRLAEIYVRKKYEGFGQYLQFRRGLKSLFQRVSERLQGKEGTVCYLLSPFEYGWEQGMPYLEGVSLESIYFENAYVTASRAEGPVVCSAESKCLLGRKSSICRPASLALWGLLGDMLEEEGGGLHLLQIPTDIYIPWVFPDVSCGGCPDRIGDSQKIHGRKPAAEQHLLARKYVDGQLGFYDSLLGTKATRVYFGSRSGRPSSCHAMMMVKSPWQEPLRVSSYFSDADCCKMVEGIVKGQKVIGSMIES